MELSKFPENPDDPLPDFIIAGIQKSGTTTLNRILAEHKNVFLQDDGKAFFRMDDFAAQSGFYPYVNGEWTYHDLEENFDEYYEWYTSIFEQADEDQLIGEDTPLYLTSERAAQRIQRVMPEVKLLFILRNPVDRAYSNYWHKFRNGKAIFDFERTLSYMGDEILRRGYYEKYLRKYFDLFDRDQIKVIIFEHFIEEMQSVANEVYDFLGLEPLDLSTMETHKHQAKAPRSMTFQIYLNRLFRDLNTNRYSDQLPNMPTTNKNPLLKFLYQQLKWLNMTRSKRPPEMKSETRDFLQNIYARENSELGSLLGRDLSKYWPYMG